LGYKADRQPRHTPATGCASTSYITVYMLLMAPIHSI